MSHHLDDSDLNDALKADEHGRDLRPAVDAAIERFIASMPIRRPSAMLDARIHALIEHHEPSSWKRFVPLAAAAGFALAIGFVAGSWMSQTRLNGGGSFATGTVREHSPSTGSGTARSAGELILQDSSVRPAALAAPRAVDLGDEGAMQTASSLWIRTDRFRDPESGVTIERSYPEAWMLVGTPATD